MANQKICNIDSINNVCIIMLIFDVLKEKRYAKASSKSRNGNRA